MISIVYDYTFLEKCEKIKMPHVKSAATDKLEES